MVFRSGGADIKSGIQATGEKGRPASPGARRGFTSRASLSPSRLAPASSRRHNKGGRCWTAQAREPRGPLGVVVRPPDGRSPARAGGRRGRPSAHARSLPPDRAPPAPRGRGFPVVRPRRRGRYPSSPTPPRPDWTIQLCAASRLAPEVASLFRAVLIYFPAAERARGVRGAGSGREIACGAGGGAASAGSAPAVWGGASCRPAAPPPQWECGAARRRCACKCETPSKVCAPPAALCPRDPRPGRSDRQSPTPRAAGLARGVRAAGAGPPGEGAVAPGRMRGAGGPNVSQVFETGIWVFHVGQVRRGGRRAPLPALARPRPRPRRRGARPHARPCPPRARGRRAPARPARSRSPGPGGAARRCSGAGPAGVGGGARRRAGAVHFAAPGSEGAGAGGSGKPRGVAGDRGEPC